MASDGSAELTRENFQGTPAFTAPGRAPGLRDLDGRVDIHARGRIVVNGTPRL